MAEVSPVVSCNQQVSQSSCMLSFGSYSLHRAHHKFMHFFQSYHCPGSHFFEVVRPLILIKCQKINELLLEVLAVKIQMTLWFFLRVACGGDLGCFVLYLCCVDVNDADDKIKILLHHVWHMYL